MSQTIVTKMILIVKVVEMEIQLQLLNCLTMEKLVQVVMTRCPVITQEVSNENEKNLTS